MPKKIIFLSVVLCIFAIGCTTMYNPATGRREFIIIPTQTEVAMGNSLHKNLLEDYKLSTDEDKIRGVRSIGQKLASISDRQDYKYEFFVIDKEEMNAFTIPGGKIYIFEGLLDKLPSVDAVAAVLVHEIAHCAARHTVKRFQANMGYSLISALIFSQVEMDEKTKTTAAIASNLGAQLIFAAYSRSDEYEADKLGMKYLHRAGYNPSGLIEAFKVLKEASKGPSIPLYLRTHPYLDDRIKTSQKELLLYTKK